MTYVKGTERGNENHRAARQYSMYERALDAPIVWFKQNVQLPSEPHRELPHGPESWPMSQYRHRKGILKSGLDRRSACGTGPLSGARAAEGRRAEQIFRVAANVIRIYDCSGSLDSDIPFSVS